MNSDDSSKWLAAASNAPASRVLIVDDEESIRLVLARFLSSRGFHVEMAPTGHAALETLGLANFDLMLCDLRMPGMSGIEVLSAAMKMDENLAVVILSAVNEAHTATEAMTLGALDYLTKPVELQLLHDAVTRALHKRNLLIEQRRIERAIRGEVAARTFQLEREKSHLRELTVRVAESLVAAMEAKDSFQRGHSARVGDLAASIAEHMRLAPDFVEDVRIAGRLHDVGNIGVRDDVLNKPGPLSPDEFEHIKSHVRIGVEILSPLRHIERAVAFVGDHHERWDGSGYPNGKAGEEISLGGRIVTTAIVFDAITSRRAYRDPIARDEAVDFLSTHCGSLLDARAYEALRAVVRRNKSLVFLEAVNA